MSNTKLRSASYSINQMIQYMNIPSFASRADMRTMLVRCIKDLHELGYKVGHIKGIKERQVKALVDLWKAQEKSPATIKNYIAKLRKVAHHLGTPSIIHPDNNAYEIPSRSYTPTKIKQLMKLIYLAV